MGALHKLQYNHAGPLVCKLYLGKHGGEEKKGNIWQKKFKVEKHLNIWPISRFKEICCLRRLISIGSIALCYRFDSAKLLSVLMIGTDTLHTHGCQLKPSLGFNSVTLALALRLDVKALKDFLPEV